MTVVYVQGITEASVTLIVKPPCDIDISKNDIVKEALFEFLNKSKQTITASGLYSSVAYGYYMSFYQ